MEVTLYLKKAAYLLNTEILKSTTHYHHRYLPNLPRNLEPLHKLLRKSRKCGWEREQKQSFEKKGDTVLTKVVNPLQNISEILHKNNWGRK